jgi:hypothetical protein
MLFQQGFRRTLFNQAPIKGRMHRLILGSAANALRNSSNRTWTTPSQEPVSGQPTPKDLTVKPDPRTNWILRQPTLPPQATQKHQNETKNSKLTKVIWNTRIFSINAIEKHKYLMIQVNYSDNHYNFVLFSFVNLITTPLDFKSFGLIRNPDGIRSWRFLNYC